GSNVNSINGQPAGDLSALNVTTKQLANWIPPIVRVNLGGVSQLHIFSNTLYFSGGFTQVGTEARTNAAGITIGTGAVKPWNFSAHLPSTSQRGFAAFLSYGQHLIIGGNFGTEGLPTNHACAIVDTLTGQVVNYLFVSGGLFGSGITALYWAASVTSLALSGDTLFAFSNGTFDTRVTAIRLTTLNINNGVLWAKYFNMIARARKMEVSGGGLFVVGENFDQIFTTNLPNETAYFERNIKGAVKLNTATGQFMNWLPDPVGLIVSDVYTMSRFQNKLFIGGTFSHVNGLERTGLAMIKASTQEVLPFAPPKLQGHEVRALKIIDNTLYAAGGYLYINDVLDRRSVLSFNLQSGQLLPWNPGNLGSAYAVEADASNVYMGGTLTEPEGGQDRQKLFAINRQTGALANWAPNPNSAVSALHITDSKLYVGGRFSTISNTSRLNIAAFDLPSLNLNGFNPQPNSQVNTIKSAHGTIWLGGNFWAVSNSNASNFVGLDAITGSVKHKPYTGFNGGSVNALYTNGCKVLAAGNFRLDANAPCNNLAVFDANNKLLQSAASLCQNNDDLGGRINAMVAIGNDVYYGGDFTKTNGKANATYFERIRMPVGYFDGCAEYISIQNGNWNTPATWKGGQVPPASAKVIVRHLVSVSSNVSCFALKVEQGGAINASIGARITIIN
ncbi:MAG: hypothetical protein EAY75_03210, partial [Bacteroidetes bacterium]